MLKSKLLLILLFFTALSPITAGESEWKYVPVNISFTHGLGLGESLSRGKNVHSTFMLNMLTGRVDSLDGAVIGGIFNQIRCGASGLQVAGVTNLTHASVKGASLSGVCNIAENSVGVSLAGIANVAKGLNGFAGITAAGVGNISAGSDRGVQAAGVGNITRGDYSGVQISGIGNVAQDLIGVQAAGAANKSQNALGLQVAGIANVSRVQIGLQVAGITSVGDELNGIHMSGITAVSTSYTGLSISGITNVSGDLRGIQIAGIVNVAGGVEGVQIGVVNYAGENKGASIGLVSIDKSYRPGAMIWIDDQLFITGALRTGSRKLYNLLIFGARPGEQNAHSFGVGLGHRFSLSENFRLDVDATAEMIRVQERVGSDNYLENFQNKVRLMSDVTLFGDFALLAGVSFNTMVSENSEGPFFLSDRDGTYTRVNSSDNLVTLSPGVVFALRFR